MKAAHPLIACLVWLCGAGLVHAADPLRAADLTDTVPGHPGLTWRDLMKLVVTDLGPDGPDGAIGHVTVPFTHIEGKDSTADPAPEFTLASVDAMPIPGDPSRIVVLADLGPSEGSIADAELLALFALTPAPRLLDVVEVGSDRLAGFRETTPTMLGPGAPLILFDSDHDNSNQSYQSTAMIFIRHDKFELIDTVFTLGDAYCAATRAAEVSYSTLAAPGPYRSVRVDIRQATKPTGEDCGEEKAPRPSVSTWRATWRWDARRDRWVKRAVQHGKLVGDDPKDF